MDEKELLKLKEEINDAKNETSELKGQEKYLMKELKDNWKCSTIQDAKTTLNDLEKEIKQIDKKIEEGIQELKEQYNV